METVTPIDPSAGVTGVLNAITGAVNSNQVALLSVVGGLIALGLIVRLVRKHAKPS